MDVGGTLAAGSRRSRTASTAERSCSKKSGRFIWPRLRVSASRGISSFVLGFGIEGFGGEFAVGLFEQDFHAAFGFFELFLAFAGEFNALFEKFHGVVEGKLRTFETADDFFEAGEGALEIGLFCWFRFFRCG
jgi:hypothetical protein